MLRSGLRSGGAAALTETERPKIKQARSLLRDLRAMSEDYEGSERGEPPTEYQRGGMDALEYAADELEGILDGE